MAAGIYTPLQLTAGSALLNNQGLLPLPTNLTNAVSSFNATTLISNLLDAIDFGITLTGTSGTTYNNLLSMGNSVCAALGDSIPSSVTNLTASTAGFAGLVQQIGNSYLGNGDVGRFAQGFLAIQGYSSSTNALVNSVVNAQTYLGPTFTSMDSLVTNQISDINPNFGGLATDLAQQGKLTNTADLANYGTPGSVLRQLASVGQMTGGLMNAVQAPLTAAGLTASDINTLLSGPGTVSENEYNILQRRAYLGMTMVTGDALNQVLDILDVTTPNLTSMADLLDPVMIFPNSYDTMQTPTPTGWVPVYDTGTSVNMNLAQTVANYLPTATGCEELGKVIPPDQAVANKSVQVALQQITGIPNTTLPELAETIQGFTPDQWDVTQPYLANSVVATGEPIPTFYRAQQAVPANTDITDTTYWAPTTLGGLNTMAGLPLVQAQTQALTQPVIDFYNNNYATGSGPNGTVTTCDIIGTAIDFRDFASRLTTATTTIQTMQSNGWLNTLNTIYVNMLGAIDAMDLQTYIDAANAEIAVIAAAHASYVTTLNTAWDYIAQYLSKERGYQTECNLDYATLNSGDKTVIYGFMQQLLVYGTETDEFGSAYFITRIADTSILGGQAMIGCLREGQNLQRMNTSRINLDITPSTTPAITPVPAVTPVY